MQAARVAMILFAAGLFAGIIWALVALHEWGEPASRRSASSPSPTYTPVPSHSAVVQAQVEAMARMRETANRGAMARQMAQDMAARQAAMNAAVQQARMDAARNQYPYRGR